MGLVVVSNEERVRTICLNRADKRNALNEEMITSLTQGFAAASTDADVRIVVLEANGSSFCAGADIEYMQRNANNSAKENLDDARRLSLLFETIARCRRPVICKLNGAAIGGGSGLVAASDIVIASQRAKFAFSEVRLGILPAVISPFVVSRIGLAASRRLFLTGELIESADATQLGLIDIAVEEDLLDQTVDRTCLNVLRGSPSALEASKALLREIDGKSQEEASSLTPQHIATQRATTDAREGFTAFLEKRKPAWATDLKRTE